MKTPVPEDVCYKDMTPQQKAIVLLWIKLKLPVEVKSKGQPKMDWLHWNDDDTPDIEPYLQCIDEPYQWYIRLKQPNQDPS